MRVLRCTWPLASALFVTLASAEIASADKAQAAPEPAAATAAGAGPTTFRLFGKTWCMGQQPTTTTTTPCDFVVPAEQPSMTAGQAPAATAAASGEAGRPLDKVFAALRQLFTGSPTAPAGTEQSGG